MNQITLSIYGRVQGVNFRRNFKKKVEEVGDITGFVKNEKDGSVFAVIQGDPKNLDTILLWAQKGTFPARVTGMQYEWSNVKKEFKDFQIIKNHKNIISDQMQSFKNLGRRIFTPFEKIKIPRHIVIIPDGNRRWARKNGWKPWVGHYAGIGFKRIQGLINEAESLGIPYMSFWGFSTENWDRHPNEIEYLWKLYRENIEKWRGLFHEKKIRFRHLGRKDRLPKDIVKSMTDLQAETARYSEFNFQFCLDYGGRDDIIRAISDMLKDGVKEVTEKTFNEYLDTGSEVPDPDLIIRTSGEQRTSGIMAYQATYAELYFTKKAFPDFERDDLRLAVMDYSARTRRFGGDNEKDFEGINIENLKIPKTLSLGSET